MEKTKKIKFIAISILILFLMGFLLFLVYLNFKKDSGIDLNENKIECYENVLYQILNVANIKPNELNVQNIRCSSEFSYIQGEMKATYFKNNDHSKNPVPLYFHRIVGGMAPSGTDGYGEVCLIINNQKIVSSITIGRDSIYKSEARCVWQNKLP